MKPLDVVKKAFTDIEKGALDRATYTGDLIFSGPVPKPIGRDEYVTLLKNLVGGIPDWNFHARDYTESGDTVKLTIAITGTHTRTLPALMPGMQPLAATKRDIMLPEEHLSVKVRGDQICEIVADIIPGGGVMGLLTQLGVQLKKAA